MPNNGFGNSSFSHDNGIKNGTSIFAKKNLFEKYLYRK